MSSQANNTDELLDRVAQGQPSAAEALLAHHRKRLVAMVRLRMDPKLAARLDPSDVVQDALTVAYNKLPEYAQRRPMPFYPWLRSIAWERIIQVRREHVLAQRRTVDREEAFFPLPEESEVILVERLEGSMSGASHRAVRRETRLRVHEVLAQMPAPSREIIVLRHLEELPFKEIAAVMGLTDEAVYSRYRRAIESLARLLNNPQS